jgi:hypothetical protein
LVGADADSGFWEGGVKIIRRYGDFEEDIIRRNKTLDFPSELYHNRGKAFVFQRMALWVYLRQIRDIQLNLEVRAVRITNYHLSIGRSSSPNV